VGVLIDASVEAKNQPGIFGLAHFRPYGRQSLVPWETSLAAPF
jgi:hypothetical protein